MPTGYCICACRQWCQALWKPCGELGSMTVYSCVSSASWWYFILKELINVPTGAVNMENRGGPKNEPWGTPDITPDVIAAATERQPPTTRIEYVRLSMTGAILGLSHRVGRDFSRARWDIDNWGYQMQHWCVKGQQDRWSLVASCRK